MSEREEMGSDQPRLSETSSSQAPSQTADVALYWRRVTALDICKQEVRGFDDMGPSRKTDIHAAVMAALASPIPDGWRDIESGPEGITVLIGGYWPDGAWWWSVGDRQGHFWNTAASGTPTRWMSLPAPPSQWEG